MRKQSIGKAVALLCNKDKDIPPEGRIILDQRAAVCVQPVRVSPDWMNAVFAAFPDITLYLPFSMQKTLDTQGFFAGVFFFLLWYCE